ELYRETRRVFVEELGLEPSPALASLEQAILRHDPDLNRPTIPAAPQQRAIMVVPADPKRLDDLLAIAVPLARRPARELILTRFLRQEDELPAAAATLADYRTALDRDGVASRVVAYTTAEPGADAVRLASEHDVDLVLLDGADVLLQDGRLSDELA